MDLIVRNASIAGRSGAPVDIGIEGGRVVALEPMLTAEGQEIDVGCRFVSSGLVETHIHLDKTRIIDRCTVREGTLQEAVAQTALAKRSFTEEDIYACARRTLEKCILNGTMLMRTHVEIDPGIRFRGFNAIQQLAKDFDHVFALACDRDVDIDMHLDLGDSPEGMDIDYVCDLTERYQYGGRVAVGHVTLPLERGRRVGAADLRFQAGPAHFQSAHRPVALRLDFSPAAAPYRQIGRGVRFNLASTVSGPRRWSNTARRQPTNATTPRERI